MYGCDVMNVKVMMLALGLATSSAVNSNAQTTWADDIIVEGNMNVGTSTEKGNLTVTGQTGNTAAPSLSVTGDGGMLFKGTQGVGQMPSLSSGPVFLWYTKKSALLVGSAYDGQLGIRSVSLFGIATGDNSFSTSSGISIGNFSSSASGGIAFGLKSTAVSWGTTHGESSFAASTGYTLGAQSSALSGAEADGVYSTAFSGGWAIGDGSFAVGMDLEIGGPATATGNSSIALGVGATSNAYASVVIGGGTADGNPTAWVDTDPVFVVGYGTSASTDPVPVQNRNALVIRKNGNIEVTTKVTMPRQGDILMGEFGNPE